MVIMSDTSGTHVRFVTKNRQCSCGIKDCQHIKAVERYLRAGGKLAPKAAEGMEREWPDRECPICGAPVTYGNLRYPDMWRCSKDSSHYWAWKGEPAVRKFLTEPHSCKRGAFYNMSVEERDVFLERVSLNMHDGGYTPHT